MSQEVLDVDMLTFEHGVGDAKRAVVDGVMKSLEKISGLKSKILQNQHLCLKILEKIH